MWYHYLICLIAAVNAVWGIYNQVFTSYSTVFARVLGGCAIAVSLYIALWAYRSATAPPPMFGTGRRR